MNPKSPAISVVVCTWNRASLLAECLTNLAHQTLERDRYEVIVIDDGSSDATPEVVRELARDFPSIRYERQSHGGLNAARNRGVDASRGDIVVFHDDDQLAPPHYLSTVLRLFEDHAEYSGIGGPVVDFGNSGVRLCSRCSWSSPELTKPVDSEQLMGGTMAIRRTTFVDVGTFDERLSGSGDESEWFSRASGHRFLTHPDAWIWHRRDWISLRQMSRMAFRQGRTIPEAAKLAGRQYRPSPRLLLHQLGHALIYRCARSWWHFCRSMGASTQWLAARSGNRA